MVVSAVSIPVLGGFGSGPLLEGRMRMAHAAIDYATSNSDSYAVNYADVAQLAFEGIINYAGDVQASRHIESGKSSI